MLTELVQRSANKKPASKMRSIMLGAMTSTLFAVSGGLSTSIADDTEIFTAEVPQPPDSSNVVFLIDTSGSMWSTMANDPNNTRKIHAVQSVFENLIFDYQNTGNHNSVNPAMEGRRIALMRFDNGDSNGGYFLTRMRVLNNGSMDGQGGFWPQIEGLVQYDDAGNRISPGGFTPLAEAAYEAARFFKGESPVYGNLDTTSPGSNDPNITNGQGNYVSPFSNANNISECSVNNHLVILTDGLPTEDGDADTAINALPNTNDCSFSEANNTDCLPEIARHLYTTDLFDNIDGTQNVMTHTIAFDLSQNNNALSLLAQTAANGGGLATQADNAMELAEAIEAILTQIQDSTLSFVNPSVSVSSSNRFMHDNTVYMGLFKPQLSPNWPGNLKGYQYNANGELKDFSSTPQDVLVDGAFSPTARSKWSTAADGGNIDQGGASEQILAQGTRNIYTQDSDTPSASTLVRFSVANENNISATDFGDNISNALKIELIQWATSRTELPIGDPLHSTPKIINYGGDADTGTGPVIFFGTNHGFLHAISARTGRELMGFIPKSLLANLRTIRDNNSQNDHPYGLDGYITYHVKDNGDGEINAEDDGDEVLIVFGMRRGGNEFFALDVTDLNNPVQKWYIRGGDGDYTDLGDTWSKPISTKMKFGNASNEPTDVVLIGGGYDNQYDELNNEIANPAGAALYAVDLNTGNCLWSASDSATSSCDSHTQVTGMSHSFPSHISAIDLTGDGVVDRLYAIDIMGRIFRVDLNFTDDDGNFVFNGQLLADLSGGTRRYYYGVDVAYTDSAFTQRLHLSVGSGHRAHPLAEVSGDIMASVFDNHVFSPLPDGYTAPTLAGLTDLTDPDTAIPSTSNGWYINLDSGEKVLSVATSTAGYVFLSTYTPPDGTQQTNPCEVAYGSGTVYAMSLLNASALNNNDRAIAINTTGIPSSVAFMTLYQPNGGDTTDNPLSSQDTEVYAMVNGMKIPLSETAHNTINTSNETTKSYWYIGEPQDDTESP